jgi:steroid delta-isomerase-like uncharacterized protein
MDRALLLQFLEACNHHDIPRIASFFADDYEGMDVAQPRPHHGIRGAYDSLGTYLRAFPDIQITPEQAIVEGDHAVVLWTARGTHKGMLMHIPPTGRQVTIRGVLVLTFFNEKICRAQYIWDVAGMLRNMGLLPEL